MKLFLISQSDNGGYDTYDSAVVCAPDEDTARRMNPSDYGGLFYDFDKNHFDAWCSSADKVKVSLIGDAAPGLPLGVVCASFNAG